MECIYTYKVNCSYCGGTAIIDQEEPIHEEYSNPDFHCPYCGYCCTDVRITNIYTLDDELDD